ncbi:DUF4384 domain-containing protein [[Phormidium] sp. ETS-05]|uniref:DUF4384 domain-containing protein n=1 Tax=[Phormidium] sp. ETS-05 TaxID=222819 RepID=UPI0018EF29E4|nr:DUF4384 domain-containing protein [[Phormidium] sp. ETS-05]
MRPLTWGPEIQNRVRSLLDALLSYEEWSNNGFSVPGHKFNWQDEDSKSPRLVVDTKLRFLVALMNKQGCQELSKLKAPDDFLRGAIARLEELEILQDNSLKDQGSEDWRLTLMLCSKNKAPNLRAFDERWKHHKQSKLQPQKPLPQAVGMQTPDQLWYQLKKQAIPTTQMGPVLAKPGQTLNMWAPETQYLKEVPVKSQIKFEVNLERDGYLVLLEKGTSGQLFCLCPSFVAPQPQLSAGPVQLPQETGRVKYFTLTGDGGREEIVALIAKEPPPLDWLPKGDQPPLELNNDHLNDLLSYLNPGPDCQVWYSDYMVVK